MTQESTEALLLRATPYGESDLVVELLTRRFGKLPVLARGARRSRRRFGGTLDFFHVFEAEVRRGRSGLGRLLGVELLRSYGVVRGEVDAYWVGSHVLEVARLGTREADPDEALFDLVADSLGALDRGGDPGSLVRVFQVRALASFGYALPTEACPSCGIPFVDRPPARVAGALACTACAGPGGQVLSLGALRTLGTALRVPGGRMGSLRVSTPIDRELGPLLEECLVSALGVRPRSMGAPPAP